MVPGRLYIVATPLGHLDDLSPRASATLKSVGVIACEDTRRTGKLLGRCGISTPTVSCHKFNERRRLDGLLDRLRQGEDVALVSDGGTPCISDPGRLLVQAAHDCGFPVSPVPGPSAVTALLSVSGMPADRFRFDGFLPHRAGERRRRLRELAREPQTLVLFETPHRIRATLEDISETLGGRTIVLGREMTKLHETVLRGTARELADALGDREVRGEITLVLQGASADDERPEPAGDRLRQLWRDALRQADGDRREALRRTAREAGLKRAELYRRLTELGEIED